MLSTEQTFRNRLHPRQAPPKHHRTSHWQDRRSPPESPARPSAERPYEPWVLHTCGHPMPVSTLTPHTAHPIMICRTTSRTRKTDAPDLAPGHPTRSLASHPPCGCTACVSIASRAGRPRPKRSSAPPLPKL
eukprot:3995111-Prymnesium_polylepis.1